MINEIADDIINFIKTSSYNAFVVIGDDEIKSVINDKCVDFDVLEYTGDEPVIIKDNKLVIFTKQDRDIWFSLTYYINGESPIIIVKNDDIYHIENLDIATLFIDIDDEFGLLYKLSMIASSGYWSRLVQKFFNDIDIKKLTYDEMITYNNILRMKN